MWSIYRGKHNFLGKYMPCISLQSTRRFSKRHVVSVNMGSFSKENLMSQDRFILRLYKISAFLVLKFFCSYGYIGQTNILFNAVNVNWKNVILLIAFIALTGH